MVRIKEVEVLQEYEVRLTFTDGNERTVDLEQYLHGPIFDEVRDPDTFRKVQVDEGPGTIVWPNGADIDPIVLYEGLAPAWADPREEP